MRGQGKALLASLVAVAWADGKFASEEKEMLEALLSAFDASDREATELCEFASTKRSLDDVQRKARTGLPNCQTPREAP